MATVQVLKDELRAAVARPQDPPYSLSDRKYRRVFQSFKDLCPAAYHDFIIPRLEQLLADLLNSRKYISVLEIGPGPESVLGKLPDSLKERINKYDAFEPHLSFPRDLRIWLRATRKRPSHLPRLQITPNISHNRFPVEEDETKKDDGASAILGQKYYVVLFCHSLYGMSDKKKAVKKAMELLSAQPRGSMVVVYHRDRLHSLRDLVCQHVASYPTGMIHVTRTQKKLNLFASFITGYLAKKEDDRKQWRKICDDWGRQEQSRPGDLSFRCPEIMLVFSRDADTMLNELLESVELVSTSRAIKNREAHARHPPAMVRPKNLRELQQCVHWAVKHEVGLTVISGSHSGHCVQPNVVAIDMSAFNHMFSVVPGKSALDSEDKFIAVGAGCLAGQIIETTMGLGQTIPLGSRPSVGAGLWLQGGIGHMTRRYGLTCDSIVAAVVVSAKDGNIMRIGDLPPPAVWPKKKWATQPDDHADLLWALCGAGTNFGIVSEVIFRVNTASNFHIQAWRLLMPSEAEIVDEIKRFKVVIAQKLSGHCSADLYFYEDDGKLKLGVQMWEAFPPGPDPASKRFEKPPEVWKDRNVESDGFKRLNTLEAFDADMAVSTLCAGLKTSSFKRCIFLKDIGYPDTIACLLAAMRSKPTKYCYFHLLQGGQAIRAVSPDATAFGCRDWDYACVITGVWERKDDEVESSIAQDVVDWVYSVAHDLLDSGGVGAYSADLGPDPRDLALTERAFGFNVARLSRVKRAFDPQDMMRYACQLPKKPRRLKLIVLVTGAHGAGKDHSAEKWAEVFRSHGSSRALVLSISRASKLEYARATPGVDEDRLMNDRAYKEQHRDALNSFYLAQKVSRPNIDSEHFLQLIHEALDNDYNILFVTGMRETAPLTKVAQLVPDLKVVQVDVQVSEETRARRRRKTDQTPPSPLVYAPTFIFDNESYDSAKAISFARDHLLPLIAKDLHQKLPRLVLRISCYPRPDIDFRHILGITEQPGGLKLCTHLLARSLTNWSSVSRIVTCEAGGFLFASPLSVMVNVPLAIVRDAKDKLPKPTVSVAKPMLNITAASAHERGGEKIEMARGTIPLNAERVVIVDDVLASGETLCAVLELLGEIGLKPGQVDILVVAEFPARKGRKRLFERGFGMARVQSLLVYSGK